MCGRPVGWARLPAGHHAATVRRLAGGFGEGTTAHIQAIGRGQGREAPDASGAPPPPPAGGRGKQGCSGGTTGGCNGGTAAAVSAMLGQPPGCCVAQVVRVTVLNVAYAGPWANHGGHQIEALANGGEGGGGAFIRPWA